MSRLLTLFALLFLVTACAQPEAEAPAEAAADEPMEEMTEAPAALLNANSATEEELATAVGADLAAAIVAARPFDDATGLEAVVEATAPDSDRAELYASVFVPIELNSATKEAIMLIPGMTDHMHHEFEEYRPYDSMDRFYTEIGKYVDNTELERLAMYVEIR
ncbi:MAG: hypothetical protein JJ896_14600 [Rhodothermales bacterium]|nr:hypothetical protein [Rhodothermales bacterium]MBO6780881.1 hypothetical protein [Rhodothermales bacterium]